MSFILRKIHSDFDNNSFDGFIKHICLNVRVQAHVSLKREKTSQCYTPSGGNKAAFWGLDEEAKWIIIDDRKEMDEIFLSGIVVFSINAVDFIISFSKTIKLSK